MPGPKKGAAPRYRRPKSDLFGPQYGTIVPNLGAKTLPGRKYELPSGEVLSNRKYRERVRQAQYGFAAPLSSEQFARLNRTIAKQVAQSKYADRPEEGRLIALRAAAIGSYDTRRAQNDMYDILRNELGYNERVEIVWWEADEYYEDDAA